MSLHTDPTQPLADWIAVQLQHSARAMQRSISPLAIVKERPGFGQTVRPVAGSIIASPVLGAYDPDPDYFFHWFRDSAVVIDALRLLLLAGHVETAQALQQLRDFARFSLGLNQLDGRRDAAVPDRRARVTPKFLQYLREDDDLQRAHGDAIVAETRVNPDGTLDVSRWARPQHDGPPLRALAMLRWLRDVPLDAALQADVAALLRFDLGFTLRHGREPSFDIWEEENGHHYYTLRVSAAALEAGAAWLQTQAEPGDAALAQRCHDEALHLLTLLDSFWVDEPDGPTAGGGYLRSRGLAHEPLSPKALDIAVILSAVHTHETPALSGLKASSVQPAPHTVADPRLHATLARLEALFDAAYAINRDRPAGRGPAMGRYLGDVYYAGGAYFFSTLGASEFCFRAAALGTPDAAAWFARGEATLATVRAYTPADGELAEQFDQTTGAPASASQLAWSYAAFISCVTARELAARELAARELASPAAEGPH